MDDRAILPPNGMRLAILGSRSASGWQKPQAGSSTCLRPWRVRSYPPSMLRLNRRDLEGALEFVHAAPSAQGSEPFPRPVIELLARLIPGESVAYHEWDLRSRYRPTVSVDVPVITMPADVVEATMHLCSTYPLSILRHSSATRPRRLSDFISLRALHRLDYYNHVLRPFAVEYQMRLWLPAPPGTSRVFYFNRRAADGDFSDRERDLLELLRPFLMVLRERFDHRETKIPIDANCLTDREAEILQWVAGGKTNQEIAAILVVSAHTVRKHLENAYAKLGVHTRTAAVARATSYQR
jgi:DNA-binding CsgD family transcriptional regulator